MPYVITDTQISSFRVAVARARSLASRKGYPYVVVYDEDDGYCVLSERDYLMQDEDSRIIYHTQEG